jgi:hypothetical protein
MRDTSSYQVVGFALGCIVGAIIANNIIFPALVGYTLKEVLRLL